MTFVSSFVYYIVAGYLLPSISAISVLCLLGKDSIATQQIGSGLHGLGLGSFTLDWATISYLGSSLAYPAFAIINTLVRFFHVIYVVLLLLYYNNVYNAKKFPIISAHIFDSEGQMYDISRILNHKNFDINLAAYDGYSKLYLSVNFALNYGLGFTILAPTLSHVAFFHRKLMKQNHDAVPRWWFYIILVSMVALALWTCEGFDKQLQLPWWGVLLACAMALVFALPVGIIAATTNSLVGTPVASSVYFGTAWWLLTTVKHICETSLLPKGGPRTCPRDDVFYNASIIWGVGWWARHNYILSAGLDAGVAFLGVLLYLSLQSRNIFGPEWWGLQADDTARWPNVPPLRGSRSKDVLHSDAIKSPVWHYFYIYDVHFVHMEGKEVASNVN
ncbi:hypothetical protein CRG98_023351 [Punica granatum]|uniref:Uncharacterized protein n=1 Tax=Punica granatum TaxID=22663 RepID=A0A2I0JJ97_PUNGR|nr:hypothetical protein CRG98_023351 [Punica granatum]